MDCAHHNIYVSIVNRNRFSVLNSKIFCKKV